MLSYYNSSDTLLFKETRDYSSIIHAHVPLFLIYFFPAGCPTDVVLSVVGYLTVLFLNCLSFAGPINNALNFNNEMHTVVVVRLVLLVS